MWSVNQAELKRPGVYEWLKNLSDRIRTEFVYDPYATDVQTKVSDMIGTRRGVCQDFAYLMIAICRASRIPVRYVSGFYRKSAGQKP
ncbi:transglutaminase family protein [Paenibacillus tarimensis]